MAIPISPKNEWESDEEYYERLERYIGTTRDGRDSALFLTIFLTIVFAVIIKLIY